MAGVFATAVFFAAGFLADAAFLGAGFAAASALTVFFTVVVGLVSRVVVAYERVAEKADA